MMAIRIGFPLFVAAATYSAPRLQDWMRNEERFSTGTIQELYRGSLYLLEAAKSATIYLLGERAWKLLSIGSSNAWLGALSYAIQIQCGAILSIYLLATYLIVGSVALYYYERALQEQNHARALPPAALSRALLRANAYLRAATESCLEVQHPDRLLNAHKEALIEAVGKLTPEELQNPQFLTHRDNFLKAFIEKIRQNNAPPLHVQLATREVRERAPFQLPHFQENRNTTYKKAHTLVQKWFSLFINPNQIFNTLGREDLESIRINGISIHTVIKEHTKLKKVCKDATFLQYAKIALLAETLLDSFASGDIESRKRKTVNLISLAPIDYNPISQFPQTFVSLFPRLFRDDEEHTPSLSNSREQPEARFFFQTKRQLKLEVQQNFAISQFQEGRSVELIRFAQKAELAKPSKARLFRGVLSMSQSKK